MLIFAELNYTDKRHEFIELQKIKSGQGKLQCQMERTYDNYLKLCQNLKTLNTSPFGKTNI